MIQPQLTSADPLSDSSPLDNNQVDIAAAATPPSPAPPDHIRLVNTFVTAPKSRPQVTNSASTKPASPQ
jgi:hypothetical protein